VSVLNWIRDFDKQVQELNSDSQQVEIVELNEIHSYVFSKKLLPGMDCC